MIAHTGAGTVGYDAAGDGSPVLLLHGFPLDRSSWGPQLASPVLDVRFIAPDLPGFGESAPLATAHLDAWADWVAALLDALGHDRAVIGGLSMGGYLALAFWRRHPGRVRALILADTKAGADSEEGRAKRREMQGLVRSQGAGAVAERMIIGLVGKTTRAERPEIIASLEATMRRATPDALISALQALMDRDDSTPTLGTIAVPTWIACGDEDALTPLAESRAMHAAIAGSRLDVIPSAGHVSNIEAPVVFNRLLSAFFSATIRTDPTRPGSPL